MRSISVKTLFLTVLIITAQYLFALQNAQASADLSFSVSTQARVEVSGGDMKTVIMKLKKFATQIDETALEELRAYAKRNGRSISGVVTEAVGEYLDRANVRPSAIRRRCLARVKTIAVKPFDMGHWACAMPVTSRTDVSRKAVIS